MICSVCKVEFEGRSNAKYCSPKCRVAANRNIKDSVTDKSVTDTVTDNKPIEMSNGFPKNPQELYSLIARYKEDTWKDSPEYKELMRRLKNYPLETLKEQGYYIPGWKLK